jgi:hypothetical protein
MNWGLGLDENIIETFQSLYSNRFRYVRREDFCFCLPCADQLPGAKEPARNRSYILDFRHTYTEARLLTALEEFDN